MSCGDIYAGHLPYKDSPYLPAGVIGSDEADDRDIGRQHRFLEAVLLELRNAREKFPGEEDRLGDAEWLTVLVEEVGEVARAMQDETDDALRGELVQVAAMAMRFALSIPHGRRRVPWVTT